MGWSGISRADTASTCCTSSWPAAVTSPSLFRLEFEGIDGSLDNAAANFYWGPAQHISVFVGYNYYSMDVDASKDQWHGSFDFSYKGPWAGVVVGFGSRQ